MQHPIKPIAVGDRQLVQESLYHWWGRKRAARMMTGGRDAPEHYAYRQDAPKGAAMLFGSSNED